MIDIVIAVVVLFIVGIIFVRKTSPGVAILGLLAGVLLDQLLAQWVFGFIPPDSLTLSPYVPIIVHLLLTFTPVFVAIGAVKSPKKNAVLALLTSLALGFLMVFFGIQIMTAVPEVAAEAKNSGLFHFLDPYDNAILAAGAVLAVVEMVASHRIKNNAKKKHQ